MKQFDKKIRKLSENIHIPELYDKKVEDILQTLEDEKDMPKKRHHRKMLVGVLVCLFFLITFFALSQFDSQAGIFGFCREVIMDILGQGKEDMKDIGVKNKVVHIESKPDLMMELRETVIDTHMIYLLVRITGPADLQFTEDMGFEYFCFCEGENYNINQALAGAKNCQLIEVDEEHPNIATYLVSQAFSGELEEGTNITVCFNNLTNLPYSEHPEMLVEGLWSITVPFYLTVTDQLVIDGEPDMVFSHHTATAVVDRIELTPLGLVLRSDISSLPSDELGIADLRIDFVIKMIDGTERVLDSHDPEKMHLIKSGAISLSEENGKIYQDTILEFSEMININMVSGIYIKDLYVPVKDS